MGEARQRSDRESRAARRDDGFGPRGRGAACLAADRAARARCLPAGACMMGMDVIFGPSVERGPRSSRKVYLTFDDGPNEHATPAILSTLASERVPAAFFMVGDHVRR